LVCACVYVCDICLYMISVCVCICVYIPCMYVRGRAGVPGEVA